eukprot:tig00000367_g24471.t1
MAPASTSGAPAADARPTAPAAVVLDLEADQQRRAELQSVIDESKWKKEGAHVALPAVDHDSWQSRWTSAPIVATSSGQETKTFEFESELTPPERPYAERIPIPPASENSFESEFLVNKRPSKGGHVARQASDFFAEKKAAVARFFTRDGFLAFLRKHKIAIIATVCYAIFFGTLANTVWKDKLKWKGHVMLVILYGLMFALVKDFSAGLSFLAALTAALLFDIISQADALAGFSNAGVFQVGVLFVIAAGIEETGALDYALRRVLGNPKSKRIAILRIGLACIFLSTFLNNTPIVAMMIPIISSYSKRTGIAPSYLQMPMSFATILGGSCSYIGTSINLIAYNLAKAREPKLNLGNLFEIGIAGLPCAIAGLIYLVALGPVILPNRKSVADAEAEKSTRKYQVTMQVTKRSKIVGKSYKESGLESVTATSILWISRDGRTFAARDFDVSAATVALGDVIQYTGPEYAIKELMKADGLSVARERLTRFEETVLKQKGSEGLTLADFSVASNSPYAGKTPRELRLCTEVGALVLGIQRLEQVITTPVADTPLLGGDGLLVACPPAVVDAQRHRPEFSVVTELDDAARFVNRPSFFKMAAAAFLTIGMIVFPSVSDEVSALWYQAWTATAAQNKPSLTHTVLVAAFLMMAFKVVRPRRALSYINADVLLCIACAFGVGTALERSLLARTFADSVVDIFKGSELGLLFGVYIASVLLNAVITNAACVALIFPIVYNILKGKVALKTIVYVLMLAGSHDFSTPIGYQTNLMVQKPGGYRFLDYTKFGFPLQCICMVLAVPICYYAFLGTQM